MENIIIRRDDTNMYWCEFFHRPPEPIFELDFVSEQLYPAREMQL